MDNWISIKSQGYSIGYPQQQQQQTGSSFSLPEWGKSSLNTGIISGVYNALTQGGIIKSFGAGVAGTVAGGIAGLATSFLPSRW